MRITVTNRHIMKHRRIEHARTGRFGRRRYPTPRVCPIAQAVREMLHRVIEVFADEIVVFLPKGKSSHYPLPKSVGDWIRAYDSHKRVHTPFIFEVTSVKK
jgi:hypothetical protein